MRGQESGRQDEASLCNPVMETTFRQSAFLQVPRPSSPEDRVQRDECPVVGTAGDTDAVSSGALHFKAWERDIMLNPQNARESDALVRARSAVKTCERGERPQHRCEEKPPSWPKEQRASWMVLRASRVPQTARAGVCAPGMLEGTRAVVRLPHTALWAPGSSPVRSKVLCCVSSTSLLRNMSTFHMKQSDQVLGVTQGLLTSCCGWHLCKPMQRNG